MLPTLEEYKSIMSGEFNKELDFSYNLLVDSFFLGYDEKNWMEFEMRMAHLIEILQSVVIRNKFTNMKTKMVNMYIMMIIYKLIK